MKLKRFTIDRTTINNILSPLILVLASLAFTAILMIGVGTNPLRAYAELIKGAFGSPSRIINTINKSIPICVSAFAVALAKNAGVFNIGVEGQLLFGAFGSALAGIYIKGLPAIIHIPLAILSGMLFGAIWSLLPAVLNVKRGANLLVIFIMMNNISKLLLTWFVVGPFAGKNSLIPATEAIQDSAKLPYIIRYPNKLTIAIFIVIVTAIILYLFLYRTVIGYELRACGINREAARYSGLKVNRYIFLSLIIGGMLAGLAGSIEILGNYHKLYDGFSPGYGFDGIPIALLANGNPIGAIFGSLLFGALRVGSINMQAQAGVSSEIVDVIQGTLVVFIAAEYFIRYLLNRKKSKAKQGVVKGV